MFKCIKRKNLSLIISRNELEELTHKYPFTQTGKMYGVSDSTIHKWCKKVWTTTYKKDIKNSLK